MYLYLSECPFWALSICITSACSCPSLAFQNHSQLFDGEMLHALSLHSLHKCHSMFITSYSSITDWITSIQEPVRTTQPILLKVRKEAITGRVSFHFGDPSEKSLIELHDDLVWYYVAIPLILSDIRPYDELFDDHDWDYEHFNRFDQSIWSWWSVSHVSQIQIKRKKQLLWHYVQYIVVSVSMIDHWQYIYLVDQTIS